MEANAASTPPPQRIYAPQQTRVLPIKGRDPFSAALIGPGVNRVPQVLPAPDLIGCRVFQEGEGGGLRVAVIGPSDRKGEVPQQENILLDSFKTFVT